MIHILITLCVRLSLSQPLETAGWTPRVDCARLGKREGMLRAARNLAEKTFFCVFLVGTPLSPSLSP